MLRRFIAWFAAIVVVALPLGALAADDSLLTLQSHHSVPVTVERFEDAIHSKAAQGWMVFTRIDHAAAAEKAGLKLLPRTVVVFGNPTTGTPPMAKAASLAIDLPMKALIWQDEQGTVWLTYNSAPYLLTTVFGRHGVTAPPAAVDALASFLKGVAEQTVQ